MFLWPSQKYRVRQKQRVEAQRLKSEGALMYKDEEQAPTWVAVSKLKLLSNVISNLSRWRPNHTLLAYLVLAAGITGPTRA